MSGLELSSDNLALEQSQPTTNWSMRQIQPSGFCVAYEFKIFFTSLNECMLNSQVSIYQNFSVLPLSHQNLKYVLIGPL